MRLIDADALTKNMESVCMGIMAGTESYSSPLKEIDAAPTVDPVTHGRWIDRYRDGDWHCSRCGAIVEKHEQDYRNWYFCYHCGARMDGDKNDFD